MNIYCVITTKNRVELLQKALNSVLKQTKKPNKIIIVSDSDHDNYEKEKILALNNTVILRNKYESNYAGNLNTAIDYIIKEEYNNQSIFDISNIYIAFLDDDDTWRENYLETCRKYLYDSRDFVVAALNYIEDNESEGKKLGVPKILNKESFLSSNPHIQGSNTFIKLETLLRAGCFDESMNSTTDRDFFTRVMMLNPKYKIIDEILVDINAVNTRLRLTNDKEGKKKSLSYFYSKYGGLMSQDIENNFFKRNKMFTELFSKNDIDKNLPKYISNFKTEQTETELNFRIIFSFIMSDFDLGKRLYENIVGLNINNYKIIIFDNTNKKNKLNINENTKILTLDDFKENFEKIDILKNMKYKLEGIINDISISRIILNSFIKENSVDGDVIWILDDDMEFKYLTYENSKYTIKNLDVKNIINKFYEKADVVIGSYSLDPPVPTLSTIRTSLLDFTYKNFLNKNELYKTDILNYRDYYYDFAEKHICLETPLPCDTNNIDDIFNGKAHSRHLFVNSDETFEPYSSGGNTIIYNRNVLDIPNISPKFFDKVSRRSDFFWTRLAKERNYKVIGASFATFHNRNKTKFDFKKECDKLLKDTLGSSFNKCYKKGLKDKDIINFKNDIDNRICRIIASFYRIYGLLSICHDNKYLEYFSSSNIAWFLNKFKEYTLHYRIKSAYKCIEKNIWKFDNIINIRKYLENNKDYKLIGYGSEGFVIKNNNLYKKIFYSKLSQKIIDINLKVSMLKSNHFLPIKFANGNENGNSILFYEKEGEFTDYQGGYVKDIINLINQLKNINLVLTNLKSENFKINNGHLVLIDYGKNIEDFTYEKYERQIKRAYQMFKYYNTTNEEFGEIINLSYQNLDMGYNFGIDSFKLLLENRGKEAIMDGKIISLIQKYKPKTLLDYGAGKCKTTNSISQYIKCSVFDIDLKIIEERHDSRTRIIENIEDIIDKEKFDMVICCLVLCNVNDDWDNKILFNINNILNEKGHLIISICNPFFDDISHTELRTKGYENNYYEIHSYKKKIRVGEEEKEKEDYHRPFLYYENLFQRNGFKIIIINESDGINFDSLNCISEYLIFELEKNDYHDMDDCSLLIKACSMDYLIADSCIRHIINKLEYGQRFKEKVVIVDGENPKRNRAYSKEDLKSLKEKLSELKIEKIIDKIIYCNNEEDFELYNKYFGKESRNAYAKNGQQLLI